MNINAHVRELPVTCSTRNDSELSALKLSTPSLTPSLFNLIGLATLSLCFGGCSQTLPTQSDTRTPPTHEIKKGISTDTIETSQRTYDKYASEIIHIPQIHKNPDGDFSKERIEATARWQFEIVKTILAHLKEDPETIIFCEGAIVPLSHQEKVQQSVDSVLSTFTNKVTTPNGDIFTLRPPLEDPILRRHTSEFYKKLQALGQSMEFTGETYTVINEDSLRSLIVSGYLSALGLERGFPTNFDDANAALKDGLYNGAVELLIDTGLISKIFPVENKETIEKILDKRYRTNSLDLLKGKDLPNITPLTPDFGTLLSHDPTSADLIVRQREADVLASVQSHLESLPDDRAYKVLIVYGRAHDLSDDFKEYPSFRRDTALESRMSEILSALGR